MRRSLNAVELHGGASEKRWAWRAAVLVLVRALGNFILGWDPAVGAHAALSIVLFAWSALTRRGRYSEDIVLAAAAVSSGTLPLVAYLQLSCTGVASAMGAASRDVVFPMGVFVLCAMRYKKAVSLQVARHARPSILCSPATLLTQQTDVRAAPSRNTVETRAKLLCIGVGAAAVVSAVVTTAIGLSGRQTCGVAPARSDTAVVCLAAFSFAVAFAAAGAVAAAAVPRPGGEMRASRPSFGNVTAFASSPGMTHMTVASMVDISPEALPHPASPADAPIALGTPQSEHSLGSSGSSSVSAIDDQSQSMIAKESFLKIQKKKWATAEDAAMYAETAAESLSRRPSLTSVVTARTMVRSNSQGSFMTYGPVARTASIRRPRNPGPRRRSRPTLLLDTNSTNSETSLLVHLAGVVRPDTPSSGATSRTGPRHTSCPATTGDTPAVPVAPVTVNPLSAQAAHAVPSTPAIPTPPAAPKRAGRRRPRTSTFGGKASTPTPKHGNEFKKMLLDAVAEATTEVSDASRSQLLSGTPLESPAVSEGESAARTGTPTAHPASSMLASLSRQSPVCEELVRRPSGRSHESKDMVSIHSSMTVVERDGPMREFVNEVKVLWKVLDPTDTGYLGTVDIATLLEILGVVMVPEEMQEFSDIVDVGGLCEREAFIDAYEEFRMTDGFVAHHGRIHLAAIGSVFNGNTAQGRVIRTWKDFDNDGDGNLDTEEILPILKVLGMPHEEEDVAELFREFKVDAAEPTCIEYTDFISIFSCEHPSLVRATKFELELASAKLVIEQLRYKEAAKEKNAAKFGEASAVPSDAYSLVPQQKKQQERNDLRALLSKLMIFVLIYAVATFSISLARLVFTVSHTSLGLLFLELLSDVMLWGWVFYRVGVPTDEGGVNTILDLEDLKKHAMQPKFLLELAMVFPAEWIGLGIEGLDYNPLWRINKCLLVYFLPSFYRTTTENLGISPIPVRIGGTLFILVLQAHILACLFKFTADKVGDAAVQSATNLGPLYGDHYFSERNTWEQYLHSFDYALKTMTGWGRGSPIPAADELVLQAILVVTTGVASYAFVLASISNALQIRTTSTVFLERMDEVKSFLNYSALSPGMKQICTQYYLHMYRTTGSTEADKDLTIMQDLPYELDIAIRLVQVRLMLSRVPIFADAIHDDSFVYALSLKLRPGVLCPGEVVTEKGLPGSTMYFITHGSCEIVLANGTQLHALQKGDFFGEIALLHNVRRTATIVANAFCNVLVLEKGDFDEVCDFYPDALELIRLAAFNRLKAIMVEEARQDQARRGLVAQQHARPPIGNPDGVSVFSGPAGSPEAGPHKKSTIFLPPEKTGDDGHSVRSVDRASVTDPDLTEGSGTDGVVSVEEDAASFRTEHVAGSPSLASAPSTLASGLSGMHAKSSHSIGFSALGRVVTNVTSVMIPGGCDADAIADVSNRDVANWIDARLEAEEEGSPLSLRSRRNMKRSQSRQTAQSSRPGSVARSSLSSPASPISEDDVEEI